MRTQEQHSLGKRGIIIKTLQINKKLLAAAIITILLRLPRVIEEFGHRIVALYIVADSVLWLIALLLVVGSFVLNLNGKAKPAIACAAASAIVWGISELIKGSGTLAILNILPQIMLIVFLLKQNVVNRHTWAYLTLAAVILSEIIGMIIMIIHWQYQIPVSGIVSSRIISLLCNALPLGLVYWFGYTADNDAAQQPDAVQKTTASSYLEAYKLNRKNGGK